MKPIHTLILMAVAALGSLQRFFDPKIAAANTYDAAMETHECSVRRTNDAAVTARHLLWKKGAGDLTIALNGAADLPLGTVDNTETGTGSGQTVLLLGKGRTKLMVASEAITAGEDIYTAANGKVQDRPAGAGTYWRVGTALTPAGADGDVIEVQDCVPQIYVVA